MGQAHAEAGSVGDGGLQVLSRQAAAAPKVDKSQLGRS